MPLSGKTFVKNGKTFATNGETPKVKEPPTSEELDKALLYIDDLLDRAVCPFMVGGLTARCVMEQEPSLDGRKLRGRKIEILIRKRHLTKEVLSSLKTHPISGKERTFKETDTGYYIEHENVPIEIRVIKTNYSFLQNPDRSFYMVMDLGIPNPFKQYWKVRGVLK